MGNKCFKIYAPSRGLEDTAGNAFSGAGRAGADTGAEKSSSSPNPSKSTTFAGVFVGADAGGADGAVDDVELRGAAPVPLERTVVEFERRGAEISSSPALYSSNPRCPLLSRKPPLEPP